MRTDVDRPFNINEIDVAKPCPASWEMMRGDDRSRTCSQCDLTVYNVADLTKAEAVSLIEGRDGRMCIRFRRRPDGTVITRDCPRGLAAYRKRLAGFAGTVFAAILGLVSLTNAQRLSVKDSQGVRSETAVEIPIVQGTVTDLIGAVIPGAKVVVKTANGKLIATKTDSRGRFRLISMSFANGPNRISIDANGFNTFRDDFSITRRELIDFPINLEAGAMIGVVVVKSSPSIDMRSSERSVTFRNDRK